MARPLRPSPPPGSANDQVLKRKFSKFVSDVYFETDHETLKNQR